eukprot:8035302-Alexandrium_andersonii.AAC.1
MTCDAVPQRRPSHVPASQRGLRPRPPRRKASRGSVPARRTRTRRPSWAYRRAVRTLPCRRGPRGALRGARRRAPPARAPPD